MPPKRIEGGFNPSPNLSNQIFLSLGLRKVEIISMQQWFIHSLQNQLSGAMTSDGGFDEAAVGYGGLQQVSANIMGSPRDDHRGIQGYP